MRLWMARHGILSAATVISVTAALLVPASAETLTRQGGGTFTVGR
jgi:hypothetical protein